MRREILSHTRGELADCAIAALTPTRSMAADGSVAFTTYQAGDGAPAGEYAATVALYRNDAPPSLLPARYADRNRADLRVRVEKRATVLDPIELTP